MHKERHKLFYYLIFGFGMILVGSSVVIGKQLTMKLPVFFTIGIRLLFSIAIESFEKPYCLYK